MRTMPKTNLRFHDQSNVAESMTKTKQDNDMIDHIHLVYAEIKTELFGPIWPNAVYEENQTRQ